MKTLPKPAGPHLIGTVAIELVDPRRSKHVASPAQGRRIFAKLWYPADESAAGHRRERLWEQLRHEPHVPGLMKLLLKPAMRVVTHSHVEAPYERRAGAPRILIYNHGLISFASENTILMEHLASHGFVVISLQHLDQLAERSALQASQSQDTKGEQARITRAIKSSSGDRRAELWRDYFRAASSTNRIVAARSLDIAYVIAQMEDLLNRIPGIGDVQAREIAGVIGLSLGGAVATEFSKLPGHAVRCVVNLDGGNYGELQDEPVGVPYLMLCCEANNGTIAQDATSGIEISREVLPGTKHLNFHDISAIYPVLKWTGAIGSADPAAVVQRRNDLVHRFVTGADAL